MSTAIRRHLPFLLPTFIGLFLVVVGLQQKMGAWESEFAAHPDEAAHYVTGLMMRDYLATEPGSHPMRFAKNYYDHYPKVALGHWPPGFYVAQSLWTLPFGASRTSLMLFMAAVTALAGTLLAAVARACSLPPPYAVGAALVFCILPLVQLFSGLIMTETAMALLCLAAAAAFGRFLRTSHWRDSVLFGLLASAAILTKGTGFLLALVPIFGIVFTRRWELLRNWRLWLSAAVVLIVCGPWTALTMRMVQDGWEQGSPSWDFTRTAVPYYLMKLALTAGPIALALALFGGVRHLRKPVAPLPAALAALAVGGVLFHFIMPCGHEARHLIPLLPAILIGAAYGASLLPKPQISVPIALIAIIAISVRPAEKRWLGMRQAADTAVQQIADTPDEPILIVSDARGEGAFIAEIAMADPKRPTFTIARSSKLFADSGWSGADYQTTVADAQGAIAAIREAKIKWIVVDHLVKTERRTAHVTLLREALGDAAVATPAATLPFQRNEALAPDGLRIYQILPASPTLP